MAPRAAPILPPGGAAAANANSPQSGQVAPKASAPAQPPYGGQQGGSAATPGGTNPGWQTYVDEATANAGTPNDADYAKINEAHTKLAYAYAQVQQAEQQVATTHDTYQQAVTAYNQLQAKANSDPNGQILMAESLKNAQATVDNTWNAYKAALDNRLTWQNAVGSQLPSDDPNVVAANQAKLVEDNVAAKKAQLDYAIYANHAGTAAGIAEQQGQLKTESDAMDNVLKQHGLDRLTKDDAYNDALRQQNLDLGAYGPKTAQADIDYKAGLAAQAQATADSTTAGIPGVKAAGNLTQQYVDAGYGTAATNQVKATTAGTEADTAGKQIANAQATAGPDATFINQLGKAIADPTNPMSSTTAADLYFNHVYGGSQLERKQEANKQASGLFNTMATAGMVVSPGQQYIRGAEPGGTFQNIMGRLGNTGYRPQPFSAHSAPDMAALAGIDISPTQGLPTQSPFTTQGGANPQFQSPNMAGSSPGFAGQVNGQSTGLVLGNMTPREYRAHMQAQQGGVQ